MTQAGAAPAIELVNVTKRYGDAVALDGVSLQIESGEFFCLLGPSGCGKTTTLNLIGGFIPLTSGELRIEGQRVNDLPPHRRDVNTVFQNYALFPHMSVADNVAFGLRMESLPDDEVGRRVGEYLELVGLAEYRDRYPGQLSGGQAQRVALARALAKRPAVLLLDEPLGALDLKLRKQMQVELSRIHRQVGTTFVFVTHDQEEALSMATRIAVMSGGHVRQIGTPREIYLGPIDRFVADFIGESNFLDGRVAANGAGARVPVEQRHGRPDPGERRRDGERPRRADDPARIARRRPPRAGRLDTERRHRWPGHERRIHGQPHQDHGPDRRRDPRRASVPQRVGRARRRGGDVGSRGARLVGSARVNGRHRRRPPRVGRRVSRRS